MPAGWNPKPDACVRSSAAHLRVHERWLIPIMAVAVCAAGAQIVLDAEGGRVLLIKRGASRAAPPGVRGQCWRGTALFRAGGFEADSACAL